jgi:hypothetical protein
MTSLLYGIAVVFVFVAGCGLLGPTLVSATSSVSVVVGFLVFPFTIYAVYRIIKKWTTTVEGQTVINKFKETA